MQICIPVVEDCGLESRVSAAGITVYRAEHPTVGETLAAYTAGALQPLGHNQACGGHHGHHDA